MSKKEQIQKDFVQAFKDKDETKKAALSSIKAEVLTFEKANSAKTAGDNDVLKIIASGVKRRKQSIDAFTEGGRPELAAKEQAEIDVLQSYLPKQMSREEIESAAREIMQGFPSAITNMQALVGKTMGEFGKRYVGQADMQVVKEVITEIANA